MTHIHEACERAGFHVVSEGSTAPKVVLGRLIAALRTLTTDSAFAEDLDFVEEVIDRVVPAEALENEQEAWWETEESTAFLSSLFACLTECGPRGFIFTAEGSWDRLGFFRLEDLPEATRPDYQQSTASSESICPDGLPRRAASVWRLALPADLCRAPGPEQPGRVRALTER